jgi:hypothetical protein
MTSGLEDKPHSLRLRPILEQPDSPLLCLPGELRNRIYSYALEHPQGYIRYHEISGYSLLARPSVRKSNFVGNFSGFYKGEDEDFNQLKFVCRQIYIETACLELRFNYINFCGDFESTKVSWHPAQLFTEFLKECAPAKASLLSRVELELRGPACLPFPGSVVPLESSVTLEIVADFCRMYPQCEVKYHIEAFHAEDSPDYFFTQGEFITRAVRHKKIKSLVPQSPFFDPEEAEGWATSRCVKRLNVPNFRIFPSKTRYISECFLEELAETAGMTDADKRASLELAEDWFDYGI